MLTDYEIALLLQQQYDGVQDVFDVSAPYGIVSWALKHFEDEDIIAFEGSHTVPDWERDFNAAMIQVDGLGGVHGGFYDGLPDVLKTILALVKTDRPIRVCGHSLGGGESHIFTAMLANAGFTKLETITFGSPFPGNQKLADLIAPFPNRSYWNHLNPFYQDIVGDVPVRLPGEPYVFPGERIKFWSAPTPENPWGQGHYLAPHNMRDCYILGMERLKNG